MAAAKSFVSEFTINLTPISLVGSLKNLKRTGVAKETSLTTICPTCEEPTKLSQSYNCPDEHGPFAMGQTDKAREVGGKLIRVGAEAAKAARKSDLPENFLDVTVHPREQVEANTQPGGNAYIFVPKHGTQQYGVLCDLVLFDENVAFVGVCNLRNATTFVRLTRWEDKLVLQQLLYPDDLNSDVDVPTIKYEQEFLAAMDEFVSKSIKEFDPANYTDKTKERIAALAEAAATGIPMPPAPVKKTEDDIALQKLKDLLNA